MQHLHLLIPTLRSSSIRPEEEALRAALEEIDEEIRRPGGMGRMRGKLNELWALIGAVKAVRERDAKGVSDGNVEWAVVDEEGLAQIAQVRSFVALTSFLAISLYLLDFGRATSWPGLPDENSSERPQRLGSDQGDGGVGGHRDGLIAARSPCCV